MKKILHLLLICIFSSGLYTKAQDGKSLLSKSDLNFLEVLTKDVMDSSRIYPNQKIVADFGGNNTGGTLIRPGGRACYPAFWIRDYVLSLESGFVTQEEQKHMLILTATTQCVQTFITGSGSIVPAGAIADHIRIDDSKPIFFPGTYDFDTQGGKTWGMTPPYGDQYLFIHMAWFYVKTTGSSNILTEEINGIKLIDRLEMAFRVPPTETKGVLVYTSEDFRGVDFGFRDVITITGKLCLPSLLKYRASLELAELLEMLNLQENASRYKLIASQLKIRIPEVFSDQRGMMLASTGKGNQPDVWSTALAVYFGVLEGENRTKTCRFLRDSYLSGTLAKNGNIRHILTCDDFSDTSAWESSLAKKNYYQNGAYWGTATGWVCYAISQVDVGAAKQLAKEYINNLREGDFRKGTDYGAPWECYNIDKPQNAVYLTTVSCPLAAFKRE